MCAIAGIVSNSSVNQELYDALTIMQHRGQDAAGIMTSDDDSTLHLRKQNGMVTDVFRRSDMLSLTGNMVLPIVVTLPLVAPLAKKLSRCL